MTDRTIIATDRTVFLATGPVGPRGQSGEIALAAERVANRAYFHAAPEAWQDFRTSPDGDLTVLPTGQTWRVQHVGTSNKPVVVGGKLVVPNNTTGSVAAGYATVQLEGNVKWIGADFVCESYTTNNGSLCLAVWKTQFTSGQPIPDSPLHFVVGPYVWGVDVWNGNSSTNLISGVFPTPLTADGVTIHRMEAEIVGNTVFVYLPDGQVKSVTDSRIGSNAGRWANVEPFRLNADTDSNCKVVQAWASSRDTPNGARPLGLASSVRAIKKVADAIPIVLNPTVTDYAPATNADQAVPTSDGPAAGVGAPENLRVTVTAPASGKVLVELSGYLSMSGSTRVFWSLRYGAGNYKTINVVGQQFTGMVSSRHLLTGLNPGTTYAFEWRHFALAANTATLKLDGPNGYTATMVATPIAA